MCVFNNLCQLFKWCLIQILISIFDASAILSWLTFLIHFCLFSLQLPHYGIGRIVVKHNQKIQDAPSYWRVTGVQVDHTAEVSFQ